MDFSYFDLWFYDKAGDSSSCSTYGFLIFWYMILGFKMYFLALIGYWELLLFFLTESKSVGMS